MSSKNPINIEQVLKCIYFTNDIQVSHIINDKVIYSLPEKIINSQSIINRSINHTTVLHNEKNISIIQNEFKEQYIQFFLKNKNDFILIGPFLNKKIESGELSNMVRENIIPFHQKTNMEKYYLTLPVFSKEKTYYVIKILEYLLTNKNNSKKAEDVIYDFQNDQYIKQKNEYRKSSFLHSPYFIEQEISKHISNGESNKTKELLKEINLMPHAKLASSTLRSFKNSMICSCSYMTRAAIAGGVNPDDAFTLSDTFINNIEEISSLEELEKFESKMVEYFSSKVKEAKAQTYTKPILDCIYYIDNHLCDDLSISVLAKAVYLNPSYLSALFHKETGKTIKQWILQKRILESSHLIINTNEDIAKIAIFYKFCSQSYYVQCFKKIMGKTPGEYRKALT